MSDDATEQEDERRMVRKKMFLERTPGVDKHVESFCFLISIYFLERCVRGHVMTLIISQSQEEPQQAHGLYMLQDDK